MTEGTYREDELRRKMREGERINVLRDGEVIDYECILLPTGTFGWNLTVRVLSTNQRSLLSRPWVLAWNQEKPMLVWELSNGQLAALPVAEELVGERDLRNWSGAGHANH